MSSLSEIKLYFEDAEEYPEIKKAIRRYKDRMARKKRDKNSELSKKTTQRPRRRRSQ